MHPKAPAGATTQSGKRELMPLHWMDALQTAAMVKSSASKNDGDALTAGCRSYHLVVVRMFLPGCINYLPHPDPAGFKRPARVSLRSSSHTAGSNQFSMHAHGSNAACADYPATGAQRLTRCGMTVKFSNTHLSVAWRRILRIRANVANRISDGMDRSIRSCLSIIETHRVDGFQTGCCPPVYNRKVLSTDVYMDFRTMAGNDAARCLGWPLT